ncbi:hypothetical protein AB0L88_24635 [Saccharopolyspora shandongensis]|uniref:hypothetical protein n=1 Tax=Saccharopolyspora shandongensis TaxID=418495 RepID=UPI003426BADD
MAATGPEAAVVLGRQVDRPPIPLGASAWVCGGFPSARNSGQSGPPVSAGSPAPAKLVQ